MQEQQRHPGPPGVTGDDINARLEALRNGHPEMSLPGSPDPQMFSQFQWDMRQAQMLAYAGDRSVPLIQDDTHWQPPYTYVAPQANALPAIFTHPRYNHDMPRFVNNVMDPPIAAEAVSQATGIPLDQPMRASNRYVREMTDQLHSSAQIRSGDTDAIPAYSPCGNVGAERQPVGLIAFGVTNPYHAADLEAIHVGQQANLQRIADQAARRKGRGKGSKGPRREPEAVTQYAGTDTECTICLNDLQREEQVYRLGCNHLFHKQCWDNYMIVTDEPDCPNCRGPPATKALFKYVGNEGSGARAQARRLAAASTHHTESSSEGDFADARSTSAFMMTDEQHREWLNSWSPLSAAEYFGQAAEQDSTIGVHGDTHPEVVHLKQMNRTVLPDDKLSILLDTGSMISVIGKNTEKKLALRAIAHGQEPKYVPRKHRLNINGVGTDSASCDYEVTIPIAVKFEDQEATNQSFHANIADGCGADLPAILGADSMREKDAVIVMRKDKEMIVFPGPGGYKIEWSPGTRMLPLVAAPSGHLVIPCDHFAELSKTKSTEEQIAFWTDHTTKCE